MLAFITSLRHPTNSNDYARVEMLLLESLRSVTSQTSEDFVVIVVGNKEPKVPLPDKVHFVRVRYPAPAERGVRVNRTTLIRDKGTKLGIGLIAARAFSPDYVMIFDADDFVHRDLAEFVGNHPGQDGWVIRDGWMYSRARSAYQPTSDFNRRCGTSFIVPFEAYAVPEDLDVRATRSQVRAAYGERLPKIIGAHKWAVEWHEAQGRRLETLPFRGAVYHVDTGENHSTNELAGWARPLGRRLSSEFGIRTDRGPLLTLWACYSPTPVKRLVSRLVSRARRLRGVPRALRRRFRRAT